MLLLYPIQSLETLFPFAFKSSRNHPVVRIDGLVSALRAAGFVRSLLQIRSRSAFGITKRAVHLHLACRRLMPAPLLPVAARRLPVSAPKTDSDAVCRRTRRFVRCVRRLAARVESRVQCSAQPKSQTRVFGCTLVVADASIVVHTPAHDARARRPRMRAEGQRDWARVAAPLRV
jgi:hypothetical protein